VVEFLDKCGAGMMRVEGEKEVLGAEARKRRLSARGGT